MGKRAGHIGLTVVQFHTDNKNVGNKDSVENWRSNSQNPSYGVRSR